VRPRSREPIAFTIGPLYFRSVSTVQEILNAMDALTPDELRIVKAKLDSQLDDDDDPALLAALEVSIAHADAHPGEGKSIEEVRAAIPKWISASKSTTQQ
jgi:hypothetical protein